MSGDRNSELNTPIICPEARGGRTLRLSSSEPKREIGQQQTELVTLIVAAIEGQTTANSSTAIT